MNLFLFDLYSSYSPKSFFFPLWVMTLLLSIWNINNIWIGVRNVKEEVIFNSRLTWRALITDGKRWTMLIFIFVFMFRNSLVIISNGIDSFWPNHLQLVNVLFSFEMSQYVKKIISCTQIYIFKNTTSTICFSVLIEETETHCIIKSKLIY